MLKGLGVGVRDNLELLIAIVSGQGFSCVGAWVASYLDLAEVPLIGVVHRRGTGRVPQKYGKALEYFYKTTGVLLQNHWSTFIKPLEWFPVGVRIRGA